MKATAFAFAFVFVALVGFMYWIDPNRGRI